MIPRTFPVPAGQYPIQPKNACWVLILAHQHRIDQLAEGELWTCACRCCEWARAQAVLEKGAKA
jgi:hypothetical protein